MSGISLVSTGLYHPEYIRGNDWYINYYASQGIEVKGLLASLGQQNRYLIDNNSENTLTMAVAAAEIALKQAEWQASELDLIIFSSQTPEYLIPATALKIHHALGGGERTLAYDMNANCAGLLIAVEQVSRIMMSRLSCQRALVVGGDYLGPHSEGEPFYHTCFADSAVAVLLVKSTASEGVIDSEFRVQTSVIDNSLFPANGLSSVQREDVSSRVKFIPFDDAVCVDVAGESIEVLLTRNGLTDEDIRYYFLSQMSLGNIRKICQLLNIPAAKAPFIGDTYGYTATNSPFIAFHELKKQGKLSRGDHLVFWTIGAGWQSAAVLIKY